MISAALFDYDGTLVNTDSVHLDAWNWALHRFGVTLDALSYAANCSGVETPRAAEKILREHPGVDLSAEALAVAKDSLYEDWVADSILPAMPGVREMLAYLSEQEIPVGLVTGSPLSGIAKTLEDNKIGQYFQTTVTRGDVERGKPAPDGYLIGLQRLGVGPRYSVSFEDTQSGIAAAKAAGMISIAIPSTFTKTHDFSRADYLCSDMFEALDVLKELQAS